MISRQTSQLLSMIVVLLILCADRPVSAQGTISTIAGNGTAGSTGDGGNPLSASLTPVATAHYQGILYIADPVHNVIRKVQETWSPMVIDTMIGNGTTGFSPDGTPAASAELNYPTGVAVDQDGNVFISDTGNRRIRVVCNATSEAFCSGRTLGAIYTVAGGGQAIVSGTSGSETIRLGDSIVHGGNQYLPDPVNDRIMLVPPSGIAYSIVGAGPGTPSPDGTDASVAHIYPPTAVGFNSAGNLFILGGYTEVVCYVLTDSFCSGKTYNAIYRITSESSGITFCTPRKYASFNTPIPCSIEGLPGNEVSIVPEVVATDPTGNVYFTDQSKVIRGLGRTTGDISTIAGTGFEGYSSDGCSATSSDMGNITALGADSSHNLYFADSAANEIRVIESDNTLNTLVSESSAPISAPTGVVLDGAGNVYFSNPGTQQVLVWAAATGVVAPVAGTGVTGFSGDGGLGTAATLNAPMGLAYGPDTGNLYIADYANLRVRAISNVTSNVGTTPAFTPTLSCGSPVVVGQTATCTYGYSYSAALPYSPPTGGVVFSLGGFTVPSISFDGIDYVANIIFNPSEGMLGSMTVTGTYAGDSNFPPAQVSTTINIVNPTAGGSGGTPTSIYSYQIADNSGNSGYAPNGNIQNYTDSVMGTWRGISYDHLNRLSGASYTPVSSAAQYLCWSYDAFGNRTNQATSNAAFMNAAGASSCSPATSASVNNNINSYGTGTSNQVQSIAGINPGTVEYDAAGNVVSDNVNKYLYDGENRICAVTAVNNSSGSGTQYIYDAEGNRVAKGIITSWSCDTTANGYSETNSYVLGPKGEQLTEMNTSSGSMAWAHTNVYESGMLIATYDTKGIHYQLSDWLGSRRVQTDVSGNIEETCTSMPFGDGPPCVVVAGAPATADDATEHRFTGKERDAESGLDYFGARYYASNMGRFMSPDWSAKPVGIPYVDLAQPQSLNLYAYVVNNPLSHKDPNGHDWFWISNKWQWQQGHEFKDGNGKVLSKNGYEYLLAFTKTGVNDKGATVGTLTLYDQNNAIASGTGAFSGGADSAHGGIPNGGYMMRLDIRGTASTSDVLMQGGGYATLKPFYGAQSIPSRIASPDGSGYFNFGIEWGTERIALNPMPGETAPDFFGNYLHGKERPGDYTHNCICDRSQHMIDEVLKLGSIHVPTQVQ